MIETAANLQSSGSVAQTVALILALAGAIAAALLFLSPKKRPAHRGFWRKVSAFVNFDRFLISSILKFLYVFATLYAVVYGLVLVFTGSLVTGLLLLLAVFLCAGVTPALVSGIGRALRLPGRARQEVR